MACKDIKYIEYNCFENFKPIGNGGFGKVYQASSKDTKETVASIVALKKLHITNQDSFIREAKKIKEFDHENIIRLYGITLDTNKEHYMVLQYANNGDLRSYLNDHFSELDWTNKIRMAKEIASGISCLHSIDIVHCDLHDKNILVHNGSLIITDFGLSKSLKNNSLSISGGCGLPAYRAPQLFQDPEYSRDKPFDIYSLGMLFWELSSGKPPFKDMAFSQIISHVNDDKRESPINGTPYDFVYIYLDAWYGNPKLRPEINEILDRLNCIQIEPVFDPDDDFALRTHRESKEFEEKLVYLNNLLETEPSNAFALGTRGETYFMMKKYEEALKDLNKSLDIDPKNASAMGFCGSTYFWLKKYDESLKDLSKSLEIEQIIPNIIRTLTYRGATYLKMKKYKKSLEDVNRSLEMDPDYICALIIRGETYCKMGEYVESLANLNRSLKMGPQGKTAIALMIRGETYREMGRYEESLEDLDRSLRIDPNNSWGLRKRGATYQKMKKYEKSLEDLNKSLEIESDDAEALKFRGITYCEMDEYEQSLVDLNKSLEIDQNDAETLKYRGKTYRMMDKHEESLADLNKSLEIEPNDAETFDERGKTYRKMGKYEEFLADSIKSDSLLKSRKLKFSKHLSLS